MSDADLIYHACLRAERRLEERANTYAKGSDMRISVMVVWASITMLREEIGNGLAKAAHSAPGASPTGVSDEGPGLKKEPSQ